MFRRRRSTLRVLSALAWLLLPACGDTEWDGTPAGMEVDACVRSPTSTRRRSLSMARPLDAAEQAFVLDPSGADRAALSSGAKGIGRAR